MNNSKTLAPRSVSHYFHNL